MTRPTATLTQVYSNVTMTLPARFEVCPECEGSGTELYGSLKGYAFTSEEFHEDPDFAESYFGGQYDVPCSCCKGNRVVPTPVVSECTMKQKRFLVVYRQEQRAKDSYEAEHRAEIRAERGGCDY